MTPFFDPVSFRANPVISDCDGMNEYLIKFSDDQLKRYHGLYCRTYGKTPLYCIQQQQLGSNESPLALQEDLSLAGELILGHGLIMTEGNYLGGGVSSVHKGLEGASFHAADGWRAFFGQTSIGLQLLAMIEGTSQIDYFESNAEQVFFGAPLDIL